MLQVLSIVFGGIVALATAIVAWIAYNNRHRVKSKYRLFISVQFNNLSDGEYEAVQKEVLEVLDSAKNYENIDSIYYFNRNIPTRADFKGKVFKPREYMKELVKCDYFIGIFQSRVHSSIYYETGFAVAEMKKCFLYTKKTENDVLPTVLAESVDLYEHVKRTEFDEIGEVAEKLKGLLPNLGNGNLTKLHSH